MSSSNEHLPLIVVTRTKPSRDASVGILLDMEDKSDLLIISGIVEGGLFDKTKLGVGMNVVSINGNPVSKHGEAVEQIEASESDVTIGAKWFVGSLVPCTVVKPNKSDKVGIVLKKHCMEETVSGHEKTGIFVVTDIVESSLFEATPLQTGMIVKSINGKNITEMNKEEFGDLMKQAESTLTLDAKVPGRGPPPNAPHGGEWYVFLVDHLGGMFKISIL